MRVSCGKMRLAPFGLNFAALPWGSDQRVQARLSFPIRPDFPEGDLGGAWAIFRYLTARRLYWRKGEASGCASSGMLKRPPRTFGNMASHSMRLQACSSIPCRPRATIRIIRSTKGAS